MKRMQRANQRTKQTIDSGIYWDYLYVDAGQLYSALGYTSGGSPITSWNRGYAYDPAWNMTAKTNNTTLNSYVVNNLNQVTNSPAGDHTFDGNGNMTAEAPGTSTARHFTYDDENQLMEVIKYASFSPSTKAEFVYDGKMRLRITREFTYYSGDWLAAGETRYLYDGMLAVQDRDSSNVPTVTYTRGPDLSGTFQGAGGIGGMLARSHGYSTFNGEWSTHNHYFADGNGNITYLVDASQAVAAQYRYDPFGNTIVASGTLSSANLYRFSSKLIHFNSTLYYYGYRFYNPSLQRWLNADPLGERGFESARDYLGSPSGSEISWFRGGTFYGQPEVPFAELLPERANLYRFVANTPTWWVDPDGRASWAPPVPPGKPYYPPPVKPPTIDPCLTECIKKCALAHLPMRAACTIGCIGAGPGYLACFLPCQTAVSIIQAVCTAACYGGSKL